MTLSEFGMNGPLLFLTYFAIYTFEYFFPLVRKKTDHHKVNLSVTAILIVINLVFTSITLGVAHWTQANHIGLLNQVSWPLLAEAMISIILLDFWGGYIAHVIFHKYAPLWRLHVVHHSDELVDVTTTFRLHPIESIIKIGFNLSGLIILGVTPWIFVLYLTVSTLQSQIEHANIRLPRKADRMLQYLFVTPNMHKVHHSKYQTETDSNYANIFSFWDRLFGTYRRRKDYKTIRYGLNFFPPKTNFTLWQLVKYPFRPTK